VWDTFTHEGGHVVNNETGDVACDSYHKYKQDVALMKQIGVYIHTLHTLSSLSLIYIHTLHTLSSLSF